MQKTSKIDVIIISQKRTLSLLRTVVSILNNNLLPKQLIIIQANKQANALLIESLIKKLCQNKKITLCFKKVTDQGISYSRNMGLKMVKSTFFCFIDDDEIAPQNWLATAQKILEKNPNLTAINGPKIPTEIKNNYFHWLNYELIVKKTLKKIRTVNFVTSGNGFFRSNFIKKHHLDFDNDFTRASEDEVFCHKLKLAGAKFKFFPSIFVYHDTSKKISQFAKQFFTYGQMGIRFHHRYLDPYSKKIIRFFKCLLVIKPYKIGKMTKNNWRLSCGYLLSNACYRLGRIWGLIKYF